jgi:hypothetical protein
MAWKNQRKIHIGNDVWYYAISKEHFNDCRNVMIKSPEGQIYQVQLGSGAITPAMVKLHIEENILDSTKVYS